MKSIAVCVLFLLGGCAQFSEAICRNEQKVNEHITHAGSFLGAPGLIIADILNFGLEIMCQSVAVPANIIHDGAAAVGIAESRPTTPHK